MRSQSLGAATRRSRVAGVGVHRRMRVCSRKDCRHRRIGYSALALEAQPDPSDWSVCCIKLSSHRPRSRQQTRQQRLQDAVRDSPQPERADLVEGDPLRFRVTRKACHLFPMRLWTPQIPNLDLDDFGNLPFSWRPYARRYDPSQERENQESRGHGLHSRQSLQDLDGVGRDADLFVRFTQRGVKQGGIRQLTFPAGKGELSSVDASFSTPHEYQSQVCVVAATERDYDRSLAHSFLSI
jgi:hypothetical protein